MFDGNFAYQIAVSVHLLSAIVWVGGVLFVALVAVPIARRMEESERIALLGQLGRRFRTVGWSALALLVATGLYLMLHWGATVSNLVDGSFFTNDRTRPLAYKLVLVAAMLVVSGIHDWWLGPRAVDQADEPDRQRRRKWAGWLGRITGLLSIAIVVLAIYVARPWL